MKETTFCERRLKGWPSWIDIQTSRELSIAEVYTG